jgi:ubiquinone/menaquinone biosynthesis C-methylase UbiE
MTGNTQRFTGRAEDYDRYRQRYPAAEVLEYLRAWCGLTPEWLVADIGAGTGMLSEVFLENGNRVLAVEPNLDMRERMRATLGKLGKCWPLEILDAAAEATTLADASIDMVAAGRAFHWFDKDRALAEFRRILKPGGWVALVSVGRAHGDRGDGSTDPATSPTLDEQSAGFERLLVAHGTDYNYVRGGYRVHENMRELFGPEAEVHQAEIHGTQQLDWAAFRGHAMSLSVVPQPDHPNYEAFQRELRVYFDSHADGGILTQPTMCHITAARL